MSAHVGAFSSYSANIKKGGNRSTPKVLRSGLLVKLKLELRDTKEDLRLILEGGWLGAETFILFDKNP
jgi:hypothetical protein